MSCLSSPQGFDYPVSSKLSTILLALAIFFSTAVVLQVIHHYTGMALRTQSREFLFLPFCLGSALIFWPAYFWFHCFYRLDPRNRGLTFNYQFLYFHHSTRILGLEELFGLGVTCVWFRIRGYRDIPPYPCYLVCAISKAGNSIPISDPLFFSSRSQANDHIARLGEMLECPVFPCPEHQCLRSTPREARPPQIDFIPLSPPTEEVPLSPKQQPGPLALLVILGGFALAVLLLTLILGYFGGP
jgi:hypothetical protein